MIQLEEGSTQERSRTLCLATRKCTLARSIAEQHKPEDAILSNGFNQGIKLAVQALGPSTQLLRDASKPQDRSSVLVLQQLRLLPQRIRLEAPERPLNPVSSIAVAANLLSRPESASQETSLAAEEDTATAEQQVRRDVAQGAGLHGGRHVGNRRFLARSEAQGGGLLGGAEGFEHCCAVAANAEGEQCA